VEKSDVEELADRLLAEHGLADQGWTFAWSSRFTRVLARTEYRDRVVRFSLPDAESDGPENVRQILLHEIAHALAGHAAQHGPAWRATARSIGYSGGRTGSSARTEARREIERDRRASAAAELGLAPLGGPLQVGREVWFMARGDLHRGRITAVRAGRCTVLAADSMRWSVTSGLLFEEATAV
jgi:hypothetical protein